MLLAGYIIGFIIIYIILRNRSNSTRSIFLLVYNYLFATALIMSASLSGHELSFAAIVKSLFSALYSSPSTMSFYGRIEAARNIQELIIFCIMSVYTIRTAILLLFKKLFIIISMAARIFFKKDIYVVWGGKDDAEALLKDIRKNVRRPACVWIPFDGNADPEMSAYPAEKSFLKKLKKSKNYHIVILPDEAKDNLSRLSWLESISSSPEKVHVSCFTDSDILRLNDLKYVNIDAYLVSKEKILSDDQIRHDLPLKFLSEREKTRLSGGILMPERPFRLYLCGFDRFCREFLLSTYENTAFSTFRNHQNGLQSIIVSSEANSKELFEIDYPALITDSFYWNHSEHPETELLDYAKGSNKIFDEVLISTGDPSVNIETALRLISILKRKGIADEYMPLICVVISSADQHNAALIKDKSFIRLIDTGADILTFDLLIGRSADRSAMEAHNRYTNATCTESDWFSMSTFTQSSNRAVVYDIDNKLILGSSISDLTGDEREEALWKLAEYEHKRWVAFHAAHGWDILPKEELKEDEWKSFITKRPDEKRHTCMVSWDELDLLPQKEPGLLKRYDYLNVSELF